MRLGEGKYLCYVDAAYPHATLPPRNQFHRPALHPTRPVIARHVWEQGDYGLDLASALGSGKAHDPEKKRLSEIIDALNRVRGPFNLNAPAIAAGAAAIEAGG